MSDIAIVDNCIQDIHRCRRIVNDLDDECHSCLLTGNALTACVDTNNCRCLSLVAAASLSQFAVYYCASDSPSYMLCGRHSGEVASGGKATVRCRQGSVGHYVKFVSEVAMTPSIATLCEVVVIGRSYSR